jgi:hypothetical protein
MSFGLQTQFRPLPLTIKGNCAENGKIAVDVLLYIKNDAIENLYAFKQTDLMALVGFFPPDDKCIETKNALTLAQKENEQEQPLKIKRSLNSVLEITQPNKKTKTNGSGTTSTTEKLPTTKEETIPMLQTSNKELIR